MDWNLDPEKIDRLTDAQVYNWYFRKHDAEADAAELAERMEVMGEDKTLEQKHADHIALCREFGHSEEKAEAEWKLWLKEQG